LPIALQLQTAALRVGKISQKPVHLGLLIHGYEPAQMSLLKPKLAVLPVLQHEAATLSRLQECFVKA
jgi:hypothetical protein